MLSVSLPIHGGDISSANDRFGVPKGGWLDLSTGINPFTYPNVTQRAEAVRRLPTSSDAAAFEAAARTYYRVPAGAALVAVPGTQAALQILPLLRPKCAVAILGPTYSEHGKTWRMTGHNVQEVSSFEALGDGDVSVLVNPNNPDGTRYDPRIIVELAEQIGARKGMLIVDEAFVDTEEGLSAVPQAGRDGLIILRSMGKFFGLAGLRLGCVICARAVAQKIKDRLGPWSVGGGVLEIGTRALSDVAWIEENRLRLSQSGDELKTLLADTGLRVIGGTDLFKLVETARARELYEALGYQGILVRAFAERPNWLRFGLPGQAENVLRLKSVLATF